MRDHPRSRGVYAEKIPRGHRLRGSSPLARGLRVDKKPADATPGIIPARAGFTGAAGSGVHDSVDHPRSRGVYRSPLNNNVEPVGSSPLARGLRDGHRQFLERIRIIPARAGFTARNPPHQRKERDHPRSRGVYIGAPVRAAASRGSSPLARGLLSVGARERDDIRIIPARAGFTCAVGHGVPQRWDHPRSRGVYIAKLWCVQPK